MSLLRAVGLAFHSSFVWHPTLASWYLNTWAQLLGPLPDRSWLKRHIGNNLRGVSWPQLKLKPRRIELASGVDALLVPTPGSLGFRAIFEHRMGHEPGVPDFLGPRMQRYDAVLEIGANVGVYTLFFSKLLPSDGQKRVLAYEPSRKAFACLQEHLGLNGCTNVAVFNCAVAAAPGDVPFYENTLDLMKGSVSADIAALFTGAAPRTTVHAVTGEHVAPLLAPHKRLLFKIDVMGAESAVLTGLLDVVVEKRPDIVLGVWKPNLAGLNQLHYIFERYRLFKIGRLGLEDRTQFSDETYCNYFLEPINIDPQPA